MTADDIRAIRLALGMTQRQFAAVIPAVSLRTLQGWESGRYTPRPATVEYVLRRVLERVERRDG
jgi:DNA-binding transcriptional regulator YiaG